MPLEAVNLTFEYRPGRPVVREVSMSLEPGSITAIVGPNGAGKSTLLRLLLGILDPAIGDVLLDGRPVRGMPHRLRARRIAYVPQRPSVAFAFSVKEYVLLGRFAAAGGRYDGLADETLARVDLADRADDPFPILSVGQQQRAALARALVQIADPPPGQQPCLLADEPVSAMDPRHALQTMAILRSLAASGAAVAVVLHDLGLAARWCDRAAVLDESGRLVATGTVERTMVPAVLDPVFGVRFQRLTVQGLPGVLVPTLPESDF